MTDDESNQPRIANLQERLLWVLSAATFLIFFQAYMLAPLIPRLAASFEVSAQAIGLAVPAYMIPYGVSTLFYGLLSDRLGRRPILLASLFAFAVLPILTATAQSASQLIAWRVVTGVGASGVVPISLALMGDLFPYERRGRPLGLLFGAMAGGMAFGAVFGAILEPFVGWRGVFVGVGALGAAIFLMLLPYRHLLGGVPEGAPRKLRDVVVGYGALLGSGRGGRTYAYVFFNGVFHSGVFSWLGLYFSQRYGLSETGIGLALLGYGIPGFLFGSPIGRAADRFGRRWLIPIGLGTAAVSSAVLILHLPLGVTTLAVAALSLGYDLTQPLFAGIVTTLDRRRGGQAMGLNVFMLFTGFGVGSWIFGEALRLDWSVALGLFSAVQLVATLLAIPLFRSEAPPQSTRGPSEAIAGKGK